MKQEIKRLTDTQLLDNFKIIAATEFEASLKLLHLINEAEERKLFIKVGYNSTFSYLVNQLKYSEGAANRRIKSARCIRKFNEVESLLLQREINLSTIIAIHNILTPENCQEILEKVKGKSVNKVKEFAAQYKPYKKVNDGITALGKKDKTQSSEEKDNQKSNNLDLFSNQDNTNPNADHNNNGPSDQPGKRGNTNTKSSNSEETQSTDSPNSPKEPDSSRPKDNKGSYKIQFEISGEFKEKFEEVKSLLSGKYPKGASFSEIFEACMDELLKNKSPLEREKRRQKRKENKAKRQAASIEKGGKKSTSSTLKQNAKVKKGRSRHIPVAIRDKVWVRDKGRCTHVNADGRVCGSAWDVEVDHVVPYAKGGEHSVDNCTIHCRSHNLTKAYQEFGGKIDSYLNKKRSAKNGQHRRIISNTANIGGSKWR